MKRVIFYLLRITASGLHRMAPSLQGRVGCLKRQWVWAQRKLPLGRLWSKHRHSPWLPLHVITAVAVGIWLPQWLSGKESACNAGDAGSIPGSGGSPGQGKGSPLQYSCLGNPMDRGAWWVKVHGIATEFDKTQCLNNNCCQCYWAFTECFQCAACSIEYFIFLRLFPFRLLIFVCARPLLLCWLSLAATSRGNSLVAVHGLLTAVASLVEHRLQGAQVSSSCSSQA